MVLRAVGEALGHMFPRVEGLPSALGGFPHVLGGLMRLLLGLLSVILTSQPDRLSFLGALSRLQEALGGVWGPHRVLFGVVWGCR